MPRPAKKRKRGVPSKVRTRQLPDGTTLRIYILPKVKKGSNRRGKANG